ncbi:MAG TPA: thiamine phosphate synthase [Chitinophaga sp.]|uniref:thiamine phosphate synthase n=1 Tax=Chitinophaga sp. TaxID=1869181 RepID=UPI002CD32876|nr:thiamine phosphate synthase [Chitinophaga sp.]HVI46292.1 thiamine phosphate synthase [Chitinophaga sp.]
MISTFHYISQGSAPADHLNNILAACEAGCKWIQLRIKNDTPQNILPVAEAAKAVCDRYQASLIINDYPHIAVAVNAAGVHVGKNDMTVAAARAITGTSMIVGGTANTVEDIRNHVTDGANYVGVGPFRFTTTKENLSPILGLGGYMRIMQELDKLRLPIPVIAIGGILLEDIPALMQTGIHGIAASGLVTSAPDKQVLVKELYTLTQKPLTWNH